MKLKISLFSLDLTKELAELEKSGVDDELNKLKAKMGGTETKADEDLTALKEEVKDDKNKTE